MLNRAAQRNAIDLELLAAMQDALDRCSREDRWRDAVLTGAQPAF